MKIFDAVVVGAGPGGMLLWERLTDAGLDVLLIEAGARSRDGAAPPPSDPGLWAYEMGDGHPLAWRRVHAVGGRTLGWGGFCHRFPQSVFEEGGWPYGARTLAPHYAEAERWLHMTRGGRLRPEFRDAARRLGWRFAPLRGARVHGRIWTALDARAAGAAMENRIAASLDVAGRRATGIRVLQPNGRSEWIAARAFALAAGPIETTRILLGSGFGETMPSIGRNLVDHMTTGYLLVEERPAPPSDGASNPAPFLQGALVSRFTGPGGADRRPYRGGFSIEITGPRRLSEMPAIAEALGIPPLEAMRSRVTFINAMGESARHEGRRVTLSKDRADDLGRPLPVLHMAADSRNALMLEDMNSACLAIAEAISGKTGGELHPLQETSPGAALFHESGTCAMGGEGRACDAWGRLGSVDNVWVADASVFPSGGDRHPTLTVLAHALRVARSMSGSLAQG
ncbi:MAG: family oxidoreductase [Rhizobiaceae bacterium]|nr:family oxidoreductase [Rhizobiaceae bacterium]